MQRAVEGVYLQRAELGRRQGCRQVPGGEGTDVPGEGENVWKLLSLRGTCLTLCVSGCACIMCVGVHTYIYVHTTHIHTYDIHPVS